MCAGRCHLPPAAYCRPTLAPRSTPSPRRTLVARPAAACAQYGLLYDDNDSEHFISGLYILPQVTDEGVACTVGHASPAATAAGGAPVRNSRVLCLSANFTSSQHAWSPRPRAFHVGEKVFARWK